VSLPSLGCGPYITKSRRRSSARHGSGRRRRGGRGVSSAALDRPPCQSEPSATSAPSDAPGSGTSVWNPSDPNSTVVLVASTRRSLGLVSAHLLDRVVGDSDGVEQTRLVPSRQRVSQGSMPAEADRAMDLIQLDLLDPEPFDRRAERSQQCALHVHLPRSGEELGGNERCSCPVRGTVLGHQPSDDALALAAAIHIGRVDERDSGVEARPRLHGWTARSGPSRSRPCPTSTCRPMPTCRGRAEGSRRSCRAA